MDPEVAALQSLDYAISAALRNGASPEDISRFVSSASKKFHDRKRGSNILLDHENQGGSALSKRPYRFVLLVFTLVITVTNIVTSSFLTPSTTTFLMEQKVSELITIESDDVEVQQPKKVKKSRYKIIVDHEKKHLDFQMEVLGLQKSQLRYPCPLDAFFHDNCWKGQGGDVCIFPGAVLKKINKGYFHEEFDSFTRLTETRFFPKLYYADENCQTILQENVRLPGETENMWCSNYTHYKDFYISAFRVFTAKNIIPVDLNTCCNTVVNDDHIRIIDFGNYRFHQKPEKVLNMNTMLLKNILNDVKETVAAHRHICDRRDRERISESSD